METALFASPFGPIELCVADGKLHSVHLLAAGRRRRRTRAHSPAMGRCLEALEGYFAGGEPVLTASDLDLEQCTAFSARVYRALMQVGPGEIVTYGELARRAGSPGAARAVGQAMGRNPLPIFVPCHRVVASNGKLGGFGAGPAWKAGLLRHEGWAVTEGKIS